MLPILLLTMAWLGRCDLPVHCLAKDIAGPWELVVDSHIHSQQPSCGHNIPDQNTDHMRNQQIISFDKFELRHFVLKLPNLVLNSENIPVGHWTMVYDEGFEIKIDDSTYFAFSKYKNVNNPFPKDDDDEQTKGYESDCSQSFMGWYYNKKEGEWSCYFARKTIRNEPNLNDISAIQGNHMKIVQRDDLVRHMPLIASQNLPMISPNYPPLQVAENSVFNVLNNHFSQIAPKHYSIQPEILPEQPDSSGFYARFKQNLPLYSIPHSHYLFSAYGQNDQLFQHDESFIQLVNGVKQNSPWKAKAHDHFKNLTHTQMQKMLGLNNFALNKLDQANYKHSENSTKEDLDTQKQKFQQQYEEIKDKMQTSFLQTEQKEKYQKESLFPSDISNRYQDSQICQQNPNDPVPVCFDWRNHNGKNYDTPVQKQGDCGSCYAMAALSAFESRIRIKSNFQLNPSLSVAGSLSCSRYNQGCNGGYPYLVGKQGHDIGFYENSCQPYSQVNAACNLECLQNQKLWKVKDYGYVGQGYYGSTNEKAMMKEIYEKGPIVVALNAAPDLYYYSTGVFITNPLNRLRQSNDRTDISSWEFTNHAVACVGWGEQVHNGEVMKYWILRNSWGSEWGENGYFKFLRGNNLAAIENQAVYMNPDIDF